MLVEMEHKAYWAIKVLNFNLQAAGEKQFLQLCELDELRLEAYESSRIYKERTKQWNNKHIIKKRFEDSAMVLLFNSKLKLLSRRLRSYDRDHIKSPMFILLVRLRCWRESIEAFTVNG